MLGNVLAGSLEAFRITGKNDIKIKGRGKEGSECSRGEPEFYAMDGINMVAV